MWIGNRPTLHLRDPEGEGLTHLTLIPALPSDGPSGSQVPTVWEGRDCHTSQPTPLAQLTSLLRIQKGGVSSGMKKVETNSYEVQRLLHVKGKRNVVAGEVGIGWGPGAWPPVPPPSLGGGQRPRRGEGQGRGGGKMMDDGRGLSGVCTSPTALQVEMSWKSFNRGDVFLLDLGKLIIQWNGPESNRMERLRVGRAQHRPSPQARPAPTCSCGPAPGLSSSQTCQISATPPRPHFPGPHASACRGGCA